MLSGCAQPKALASRFFTRDFRPGEYVLRCFVPDERDNKPHFMHGMQTEFTVQ
jgi:hypothetical protein